MSIPGYQQCRGEMGRRLCRARTSTDQEESADAGHAGDRVVGGDVETRRGETLNIVCMQKRSVFQFRILRVLATAAQYAPHCFKETNYSGKDTCQADGKHCQADNDGNLYKLGQVTNSNIL